MSVHLVGGGSPSDGEGSVYASFLAEAKVRAENAGRLEGPRIAVVLVHDGLGPENFATWRSALERVAPPLEAVAVLAPEGSTVDPESFEDVDGILVGGGLTPAYRDALEPAFARIRDLVGTGVPYLGFSAGAAIAAERAVVGGFRIGEIAVCPEEAAEDLDEVTVAPGIGLVDIAIEVHAAQWGTLGRLVAATSAGLVDGGVAIDEHTALVVGFGPLKVVGDGSVWTVSADENGARVSTLAASS